MAGKIGKKFKSLPKFRKQESKGDSKMGVYVWRNADVQIRVSEGWGINMCTLMVFKIYLYEYNDDCEPTEFPRQCLPYALLVYEKSDNPIPKPIKAPTHQYAIRPSERIKLSRSSKRDEEPAKKPETKDKITAPNYAPEMIDLCVPRLSKADTKDRTEVVETMANSLDSLSQSSDRSEYGLCVPRLTSGLPSTRDGSEIRDAPSAASVSSVPPSDPRSQLSFLQTTMYQPSFGPSDDEAEMSPIVDEDGDTVLDLNALLQKPRMPSLPPINLPFITDTRQLRDDFNELEAGIPRDPRLHKASVPVSVQSDPRLRREDPRLQTRGEPPPRRHETRYEHKPKYRSSRMDNRYSRSDSTQSRERKKLSLGDYKKKVNAVKASAISGDFVHEPDDMAKALNELSDPDDTSQSPKRASSPEIDDPTLAGAMKKLVEHSADVSLFTEALKSLQESAADFGDQLNDPEFLVKKIAEKIEDLTQVKQEKERLERERSQKEKEILERINRDRLDKMEKERLAELEREERADALFMEGFEEGEDIDLRPKIIGKIIADIQSPDSVLSPDVSNDAKYGDSQVKCIPLETSGNVENKVDGGTSSALNEAMRKTLEELSKTEKQTAVNPNPRNRLRKSRFEPQVKGTENNSVEDLESIPVPPLPEKDQIALGVVVEAED
ncbi:hypothetical protein MAR_028845 [Mya arenaria]|uniref:Uncharacterized protein n=1 Tax=Mya arenaria TaxID=6604 RepID=A0ABY7DMD0_MYAAR|nr:hypothetical protein MAR_028845 [Mya arenaria]